MSLGSDTLNFSDADMNLLELDQEENRRYSGISFRSGAYRKSTGLAPNVSQLEASKEKKAKEREKKDSQDSKVVHLTRRLSKILSVGDKIGDTGSGSNDTTPMIAEEKTFALGINVSTGMEASFSPAPLKKGFTRKGLREKQAAREKGTLGRISGEDLEGGFYK